MGFDIIQLIPDIRKGEFQFLIEETDTVKGILKLIADIGIVGKKIPDPVMDQF